jgi:uncharacterized protein (DUF2236 family)
MRAYLDRMYASNALAVGTQGRQLASAVLSPSGGCLVAPATWINRVVTIGLLPPSIREQYGLTWTDRDARLCTRLLSSLRFGRRWLPAAVALWPEARR